MTFPSKIILLASPMLAMSLIALPAKAVTQDTWFFNAPGDSCQLSLPTTDTAVRPRANGFRNEGDTNQFVICGWGSSQQSNTLYANVMGQSIDGVARTMSCTFVTRDSYTSSLKYVTKSLSVPASGVTYLNLSGADMGGTSGNPFGNADLSVTCTLPAHTAIVHLENKQRVDVGN